MGVDTERDCGVVNAQPHDTEKLRFPMYAYSTLPQRFRSKVRRSDGCWLWQGAKTSTGYGHLLVGSRIDASRHYVKAHRFSYETLIGPIPDGLGLDHLCRTPLCVNPNHLEPVTAWENIHRGIGHGSETHCPQGHAYDEANTYRNGGKRFCRKCNANRWMRGGTDG